nr:hypothetical protein [Actinocrispum wychmicini]
MHTPHSSAAELVGHEQVGIDEEVRRTDGPGQHDAAHPVIRHKLTQRIVKLHRQLKAERVELTGIVHTDDGACTVAFDEHISFCAFLSLGQRTHIDDHLISKIVRTESGGHQAGTHEIGAHPRNVTYRDDSVDSGLGRLLRVTTIDDVMKGPRLAPDVSNRSAVTAGARSRPTGESGMGHPYFSLSRVARP